MPRRLFVPLLALALSFAAYASDQTILGKQELVKDPKPGVDATKRKLLGQAKESGSTNTIVGDPTGAGATVTFFANGATSSNQVFVLPASFWAKVGTSGYQYKDATGVAGPVKVAQVKASGGKFQFKVLVVGKLGPVSVVPPNPGTDGCVQFAISGGDSYHVRFGPGSLVGKNDAKTFQLKSPPTEGLCPSTTTTTSSSTTTSTLPDCGGAVAPACNGTCQSLDFACFNIAGLGCACACALPGHFCPP